MKKKIEDPGDQARRALTRKRRGNGSIRGRLGIDHLA